MPLRLAWLALCLASAPILAQPAAQPAASVAANASSFTTSDGVALAYTVAGQGSPSLFVHGGPGSGSEVVATLAGPTLEKSFRMVYLDQRGSGRSASAPNKDYGLDRVIQDMEELRASLKIDKWVLMSHSFGGIIATAYARKHPERVSGMVLMNSILHLPASMESTASYGYTLLPANTRPPLDPAAPLPQRFGMVMGMLGQARLTGKLMYADPALETRVAAAMKGRPANRDFASTLFASGAITPYLEDMAPATASLDMPVLVISGKQDHVTGVDHYKSFHFPRQQTVLLPGAHFSMLEQPGAVAEALDGFASVLRESDKARYLAACDFLVDEVARLDKLVARSKGRATLLRHDRDSGARLYRHKDKDLRIDYLVTADGKTLVSTAEFGPGYIGKRFDADSLGKKLLLAEPLPPAFAAGCDRLDLQVTTKAARIVSMKIESDID